MAIFVHLYVYNMRVCVSPFDLIDDKLLLLG